MNKYIVISSISPEERSIIESLSDVIGDKAGFEYISTLPFHITYHRPIQNIEEEKLLNFVQSQALAAKQAIVRISQIDHFGKQYIVLPVQTNKILASMWIGLQDLLAKQPEYEHGKYGDQNTLHITVAKDFSNFFDKVWPDIEKMSLLESQISIKSLEVWRKPIVGGVWQRIKKFELM